MLSPTGRRARRPPSSRASSAFPARRSRGRCGRSPTPGSSRSGRTGAAGCSGTSSYGSPGRRSAPRLVDASRLPLARLRDRSGESALLAVPYGRPGMEILLQLDPDRHVGVADWVGADVPLHASSAGKLVLAELDDAELAAWLDANPLASFTERTVTDLETLRGELARVRRQGWAELVDELEDGPHLDLRARALAAPIPRRNRRRQRADLPAAARRGVAARAGDAGDRRRDRASARALISSVRQRTRARRCRRAVPCKTRLVSAELLEGGCSCGEIRNRLDVRSPLRELLLPLSELPAADGSAFVINMLIEDDRVDAPLRRAGGGRGSARRWQLADDLPLSRVQGRAVQPLHALRSGAILCGPGRSTVRGRSARTRTSSPARSFPGW